MSKSSVRIARLFVLSVGIAATTAIAQPANPRGGPAAHAAPVPHAPPAPHISAPQAAPQLLAPRVAPQMVAPRVAPQMTAPRVGPQQLARPSGGPSPTAIIRPEPTTRTLAAPTQERPQVGGRNLGAQGPPNLCPAQPARQSGAPTPGGRRFCSTARAHGTQCNPAKCARAELAKSAKTDLSTSWRQPSRLRPGVAQPVFCRPICRPRPQRTCPSTLDVPRPVLRSPMATSSCSPDRHRLGGVLVLAVCLQRRYRLHVLSLCV